MAQEENNGRKSQWGYFGKMVGLSIVGIIVATVAVLTCLSLWMNSYTHHNERVEVEKAKSLYRTELDWMRRMPQARGTKAQARSSYAFFIYAFFAIS